MCGGDKVRGIPTTATWVEKWDSGFALPTDSERPPPHTPKFKSQPTVQCHMLPTKQRFQLRRITGSVLKGGITIAVAHLRSRATEFTLVDPQATILMHTCIQSGSPNWGHGQCFYWQADPKLIRRPPHCLPEYKRHSVQKVQEEKPKSQDSSCSLNPQRNQRHPQCSLRPSSKFEM